MRKPGLTVAVFTSLLSLAPMNTGALMADTIPETKTERPKDCEQIFTETKWTYTLNINGKKVCAFLYKWNSESGDPERFTYTVGNTEVSVDYSSKNPLEITRKLDDGKLRRLEDYILSQRAISFSSKVANALPAYSKEEQFRTLDKDILRSRKDLFLD